MNALFPAGILQGSVAFSFSRTVTVVVSACMHSKRTCYFVANRQFNFFTLHKVMFLDLRQQTHKNPIFFKKISFSEKIIIFQLPTTKNYHGTVVWPSCYHSNRLKTLHFCKRPCWSLYTWQICPIAWRENLNIFTQESPSPSF